MCYWGVLPSNLAECYDPLVDYIREMAPAARKITREEKEFRTAGGKPAPGWTSRTAQNIYGGQGFKWNKPASAWYALHLWERYLFTMDREYLKTTAYPMMKEICRFWEGDAGNNLPGVEGREGRNAGGSDGLVPGTRPQGGRLRA